MRATLGEEIVLLLLLLLFLFDFALKIIGRGREWTALSGISTWRGVM